MNVNLNKQLTKDFKLKEFLTSKFYDKENQKKSHKEVAEKIKINLDCQK